MSTHALFIQGFVRIMTTLSHIPHVYFVNIHLIRHNLYTYPAIPGHYRGFHWHTLYHHHVMLLKRLKAYKTTLFPYLWHFEGGRYPEVELLCTQGFYVFNGWMGKKTMRNTCKRKINKWIISLPHQIKLDTSAILSGKLESKWTVKCSICFHII